MARGEKKKAERKQTRAAGSPTKAERKQATAADGATKAERREPRSAGGPTKAERKQARASGGGTKAERKQARKGRMAAPGAGAVPDAPAEDSSPDERIEWRLARIEEAVAAQSQRSEELLKRVNEMLEEPASGES